MTPRIVDTFERTEVADPVSEPTGRPWLGVRFSCNGAYQRIFRSADGSRYQATCPRCGRSVVFRVGSGGTSDRFFEVMCGG